MTATPDGTEGEGRPAAEVNPRADRARADARPSEHRQTELRATEERMGAALRRARGVLLWERVWPAIVAFAAALGVFLIASWLGLWLALPPLGRIIGLGLFAALFALALVPAFRIRPPSAGEALSRLDRESHLPHRPATALSDHLASKPDDPVGAALWRAHLARMAAQIGSLRVGMPAPGVAARDGRALRALVLLGVIATFFMVPGEHLRRIASAFDWAELVPPKPYRIDAWVTPPGYTGRAPILLPGLRSQEVAQGTAAALPDAGATFEASAMTVPAGSELVVRIIGLADAKLVTQGGLAAAAPKEGEAPVPTTGAAPSASAPPSSATPTAAASGDERRFVIAADGSARIEAPDGRFVSWHFRAQPDAPPTIELTKEPQASGNNALSLSYKAEDDYGIASAEARFTALPPAPPLHGLKNAPAPAAPRPLVDAPNFPLPLVGGRSRAATGQTTKDFTENPWAGTKVEMVLVARDQAGNVGQSKPRSFILPQRGFSNPLARALIEERRLLALDANERERVQAALDALAIAPEVFTPEPSHYMGLRTAYFRLANARSDEDLRGVVDYLWEVAVRIEDGDLSDVEKRLRDAQQALQNALENNASDEEIARLTQELRDAMNEFMKALAEEAQRNPNRADNQPMDPNTRTVRPQDLQKMLDRIEDMAKNGARDAAKQMLSELQNMLNGLQAGRQQQRQQQGQSQMSQSMDQLGDMIRRQQQLRDRTFKEGRDGQQDQAFNELKQNQEQLREQLRQLREKMQQAMRDRGQQGQQGDGQQGQGQQGPQQGQDGEGQPGQGQQGQQGQQGRGQGQGQGMPGESGLGQAEQAMREAEQALGEGDGTGAVDAQSEALQALRRGAQQMAEAMQQQQGGPGGEGPGGPSGQTAERTDPLGRPMRSRDYGDDNTVKVPEEIDMQRARRVLEELRRRFGEPDRPRLELDYLERLLRDF